MNIHRNNDSAEISKKINQRYRSDNNFIGPKYNYVENSDIMLQKF